LAKGQIDRAITEFEKMVADDPRDARSLLKLGDLYTRKGDTRGATATYRKVAAQYAQQQFFLKAVAVYKQILKLDAHDLQATEGLAEMYEKLSLASDAVATYEQVVDGYTRLGKPDKALAALGKLAGLDAQNVASWIRYAEALSKANLVDEAADAFRRGADLLKAQGRSDDYMKVTERLLFHSQEAPRARELAQMYIDRNMGKAALSHLQTCFKADPRDLETLELLARAFSQIGQGIKAISVYKEIARLHAEVGQSEQEQQALRALLALDPGDTESQRRLDALVNAPREDSQSIELIEGDEDLEDVVVVDEETSAAAKRRSAPPLEEWEREAQIARLMAECEVFLRYGLRDKVVAQLKRVLELDPQNVEAREKLKDAHLRGDELRSAVTQLRMLAEIVAASDLSRARAYLQQASQLAPGDEAVAEQIEELARGPKSAPPEDEDDVIILDDEDDAFAQPATVPDRPLLGPRETSLATALEGPPMPSSARSRSSCSRTTTRPSETQPRRRSPKPLRRRSRRPTSTARRSSTTRRATC
jgi:tetratricopeptide (TPR) repeat protein